ncbi:MAG: tagaturonate reductase, partial [Bacteroidales bacterium]|nr:tagaturonate reductase [Bacteroidales bacterium]
GKRGDDVITPNDAPEILALLQSLWVTGNCVEVAKGVLAASDLIWGEDLNKIPGLTEMLTEDLEMIQKDGMRNAVEKVMA